MLIKWRLDNFKSIGEKTELEFAPLTVFTGMNSSGKSTILQSILLVAQTLTHKVSSRSVVLNGSLARLGQYQDLRSTSKRQEKISIGWTCKPIKNSFIGREPGLIRLPINGAFDRRTIQSLVSCDLTFDLGSLDSEKEIAQIQPRLYSSHVFLSVNAPSGYTKNFFMKMERTNNASAGDKKKWKDVLERKLEQSEYGSSSGIKESMQYDVSFDEESLFEILEESPSAKTIGCLLRHFLPERVTLGVVISKAIESVLLDERMHVVVNLNRAFLDQLYMPDDLVKHIVSIIKRIEPELKTTSVGKLMLQNSEEITNALSKSSKASLGDVTLAIRRSSFLLAKEIQKELINEKELITKLIKDNLKKNQEEDLTITVSHLPPMLEDSCRYLERYFATAIKYLGPLRDEPKSLYPLSTSSDPTDVGLKGEHTAAVLDLYKNNPIQYIPSEAFEGPSICTTIVASTLEEATIDWLHYLGVAEKVKSRDLGKLGHELKVLLNGNSAEHDLTHVGVGVSQVLPILVTCLLADKDTTLIFEQPEIHLHPKVQALLADFFLSMALLGKQCIVETHSEYLINRLRYRTASESEDKIINNIKMYFVEKQQGCSKFREVILNKYGAILDWPDGFFDQSLTEAENILRAAVNKRKNDREKKQ